MENKFVSMNVKCPIWSKFYRRKKCGIKRDLMNMLFYQEQTNGFVLKTNLSTSWTQFKLTKIQI